MLYKVFKPAYDLSHLVHFYWIFEGDPSDNIEPVRVVPNGSPNMVFHYAERTFKFMNSGSNQPHILLSGQNDNFYDVVSAGDEKCIFAVFYPIAGCNFKFPFSEITNRNIALNDAIHIDQSICEALAEEPDHQKKIYIVENFLRKLCLSSEGEQSLNFRRLNSSISVANQAFGNISVDALARAACLSYKQFDRIFLSSVGVHAKQFLSIIRLQYSFKLISESPGLDLQDLAYNCGFYDLPHFTKEFKKLTGYTPAKAKADCSLASDYFMSL